MQQCEGSCAGRLGAGLRRGAVWIVLAGQGFACRAATLANSTRGGVSPGQQQAIREIADPACGVVWRLVRDMGHPDGPGRLVPVAPESEGRARDGAKTKRAWTTVPLPPQRKIIRAGDSLVVEEMTGVVEMRLSAVALMPASAGQVIEARLNAGGKRVRVIALGPGRAKLAAMREAQP